eukprot:CAMPEP_0174976600 /NCGR_PEP_ID=MMETSP0004_2-20121128/13116_1 /TAXON_ID=420556 /ORGANISM="Ochromonas sp., Strain CCMP1393" /LENGTH=69 /DNA_ID=CAMNT_0016227635 /DNA_START=298 /DNA_END=504 /DNA_ORIENTATION=+
MAVGGEEAGLLGSSASAGVGAFGTAAAAAASDGASGGASGVGELSDKLNIDMRSDRGNLSQTDKTFTNW